MPEATPTIQALAITREVVNAELPSPLPVPTIRAIAIRIVPVIQDASDPFAALRRTGGTNYVEHQS